jgi:uncharacterized protein (TIGR03000 family)
MTMLRTLWTIGIVALVGLTVLLTPASSEAQRRRGGRGSQYVLSDNSQYSLYPNSAQNGLTNPNDAGFIVRVPDPNAEIYFQDYKTQQQGFVREYETDRPLDPNQTYTFQVRARWMQNGQPVEQTRQVPARAGQNVTIDFANARNAQVFGGNSQYSFYPNSMQSGLRNPNDAGFIVRVPDPNAEIFFQDHKTRQQGFVRQFETEKALDPNQTYTFQIRARWTQNGQPVEQTRQVQASAGQNVTIDFATGNEQVPALPGQQLPNRQLQNNQQVPNQVTPNQQTPSRQTTPNERIPNQPSKTQPGQTTPTNEPQ